jgi:fructose-specific phosphotransferase system IIC component
MQRRINILFGMLGSIVLVFIEHPLVNLKMALPGMLQGFVTSFITSVLTTVGIILLVYFGILLIADALREIKK